jgi:DNA-binding response OmpR family regulator
LPLTTAALASAAAPLLPAAAPLAPAHGPGAPLATPLPLSATDAAHPGLDVLVADDNTDFSDSFAALLRIEGHRVRVCYDGDAAMTSAMAQPPDVAFLDIGMPGLNGFELATRLRARQATRRSVLIAVTGWGQESDRQRVLDAGFDLHWVKPIDTEQALALLRKFDARGVVAAPINP